MSFPLADFIPVWLVELGGLLILVVIILGSIYRFRRWAKTTPTGMLSDVMRILGPFNLIKVFFSELFHRVMLQRDVILGSRVRWLAHFAIFWGFVGTGIATTMVWLYGIAATARDFSEPAKIIGNIGGFLLLFGGTYVLLRLVFVKEYRRERTLSDALFFIMLYVTTVTGFTTQFLRMADDVQMAYLSYVIHLAAVIVLLGTAPFTHFFHALLTPSLRFLEKLAERIVGVEGSFRYKGSVITSQIAAIYAEEGKEKSEKVS